MLNLNAIQNDSGIFQSFVSGKYAKFYNIDKSLNSSGIINGFLIDGNSGFHGIASASTNNSIAWHAFDENFETLWNGEHNFSGWLQYTFFKPQYVSHYGIISEANQGFGLGRPTSWELSGSRDLNNWVLIDKVTSAPDLDGIYRDFAISGHLASNYLAYRLNILSSIANLTGVRPAIRTFRLMSTGDYIPLYSDIKFKSPSNGISFYSGQNENANILYSLSGINGIKAFLSGNIIYIEGTGSSNTSNSGNYSPPNNSGTYSPPNQSFGWYIEESGVTGNGIGPIFRTTNPILFLNFVSQSKYPATTSGVLNIEYADSMTGAWNSIFSTKPQYNSLDYTIQSNNFSLSGISSGFFIRFNIENDCGIYGKTSQLIFKQE